MKNILRNTHNRKIPYANVCKILTGGKEYFEQYLTLIRESQQDIHLQVYVFNDDDIGNIVLNELIAARERGVKVYVVLDGVGSRHLPQSFLEKFEDAGIQVRFFSKVQFSLLFRMGRRMHHKLLLVDHQKAIIGGINIADRYLGTESALPWMDYGVYLEGVICKKVYNLALRILNKRKLKKIFTKKIRQKEKANLIERVEILENDFIKRKLEIRRSYYHAIKNSERSLILVASYFLPNFKLMRLLEKGVKRGVDIKIILPHKWDIMIYPRALKYFYRRLVKRGIKIFEYYPAFLHAKVAAADHEWCSIGSYNLNDLSDLLSLELNVEIFETQIASDFQNSLEKLIKNDCIEVPESDFLKASRLQIWVWWLNYKIMMLVLNITYWVTDKNRTYPVE